MGAGGETPRTEQPVDSAQRAADVVLDGLRVTLAAAGLELHSAVLVFRLERPNPTTGRNGGFAGTLPEGTPAEAVTGELRGLLERGLRSVERTDG